MNTKYRAPSIVEIARFNAINNTWKLSKEWVYSQFYTPHLSSNVFEQKLIISASLFKSKSLKVTMSPQLNLMHFCNIYRLPYNICCWDIYAPQENERFVFSPPQHGKNADISLQMRKVTNPWFGCEDVQTSSLSSLSTKNKVATCLPF